MNDLKKYSSDEVIKLIKKTMRNYSFNDSFQLIIYWIFFNVLISL